ncbi:hypothetical protein CDG76_12845 [Nostoc sp. 'Peltigera membranacea cyanobiont' 210A]|uniref:hypothetical protein n=1 Tax=Nostoc sp. 'Peltigera membranacea cyanobiont' 210A TaxID=2014529 RepID=UPI000B9597B5|nr:hypothetical protein [Nostoc sp. 'Peltigera membranacea cyanobiont' 210A]OYD95805.1 hypothetical protein CDG76_12845 [Nostoc sp. 'Peltigera membranacea cyanobiont' 210A]
MSNINNYGVDMNNKQIKNLYSIEAVQDLSHEAAATISGGALDLSDKRGGEGRRVNNIANTQRSLGGFNNKASWYEVTGNRDWLVYTGENFTGTFKRLKAGTKGNFTGSFNNNIASVKPG